MMRLTKLTASLLLVAAACSTSSSPNPPPGSPAPDRPVSPTEQTATTLGMTIMSSNAAGAPRLLRAIVPRPAVAGMAAPDAARDHVAALAPLYVKQAPAMALTENGTQQLRNGATLVKLIQRIDDVVVHDSELRVMLHADRSLAAVSGTLLPKIAKPNFVSSPTAALERALAQFHGKSHGPVTITETGDHAGWRKLAVAGSALRVTQARARREIAMVDNRLAGVWAVEVFGDGAPDAASDPDLVAPAGWRYLVADATGKIVDSVDLMAADAFVYRTFAEPTGLRRPLDSPLESFAPHPTGVPDGSSPGFVSSNLVVMEGFNRNFDKWLPDNATTTQGNNVDAFSDFDGSGTFDSEFEIRPRVTGGRILNYQFDPEAEPLSSDDQLHAGTVNAFFLTNWMHDWWYDSGFTEATGNAQLDNFGRGGADGDRMSMLGQFGSLLGQRNNAFMGTPDDGLQPQMLMLLWSPGLLTSLTTGTGQARADHLQAGPVLFDLTADAVVVDDGVAPNTDACSPIAADLTGRIAVVTFAVGACGSRVKVDTVRAAGAAGVILVDTELDTPRLFAGSAAANIPGVAIGKTAGEALFAAIAAGPVTVTLSASLSGPERDGDLDNTVVAHEWGHYLHHRLASCGSSPQCRGMSEGWGDFNALLMMLREGDNREGTYAMGPFAVSDGTPDSAYFGIRRFPYSIDRTRNDLSFRHIGDENPIPTTTPRGPRGSATNSETHAAGEVWATMLWEAFNVLVDAHGVPAARRRISDYVVAGLLLTPPEATFTEARDAILAGASSLDADDMLLIAAAFAGRGAGTCAVSPLNNSSTNQGVVESGTLAARIQASDVSLTDDGVSCDHDGILDPGESALLHVTIANGGIIDAEEVSVTATTATPGIKLGAPISLGSLHPFTSVELAIPVTVTAAAPRNVFAAIDVRIAATGGCTRGGVTVSLVRRIGADEVEAVSRIDHVETLVTPWQATGEESDTIWAQTAEPDGNHLWFGANAGFPSDTQLMSPVLQVSPSEPFVVRLAHAYSFEVGVDLLFDGSVIELSTDGGATWADVSTFGVDPGYTGELALGGSNPLEGRQAFSGDSPGFPARQPLVLDFGTQFAGQAVQLRFRIGSDLNTFAKGWDIDDLEFSGITNTPFPDILPEQTVCTARRATSSESRVVASHASPLTSLDAYDAVCIATDTP